ncbi:hypothetical protein CcI49_38035 [Frankia sp. CcI49]|nr:hypothetical protein CcI49_38035 [Frankia sp. CcI49]
MVAPVVAAIRARRTAAGGCHRSRAVADDLERGRRVVVGGVRARRRDDHHPVRGQGRGQVPGKGLDAAHGRRELVRDDQGAGRARDLLTSRASRFPLPGRAFAGWIRRK